MSDEESRGKLESFKPIRPYLKRELMMADKEDDEEVGDMENAEDVEKEIGVPEDVEYECQNCEDENEGRRPKMRRDPAAPSPTDIREHRITHTPYRSWCPECVMARGKATGHPMMAGENKGVPGCHVDYWFMRDGRGEESRTIAVLKDEETKALAAHVVPQKGNVEWVAERLAKDVDDFGHSKKIILKSDQEKFLQHIPLLRG